MAILGKNSRIYKMGAKRGHNQKGGKKGQEVPNGGKCPQRGHYNNPVPNRQPNISTQRHFGRTTGEMSVHSKKLCPNVDDIHIKKLWRNIAFAK